MLSQKGFAFPPVLIWAAMALVGLGTFGAVVIKSDVITLNTPNTQTWGKTIIDNINKERIANNLTPLSENQLLNESSLAQAQDIVKSGTWSTDNSFRFIKSTGYNYSDYASLGQSIARNFISPEDAVRSLMADKINKDNILNKEYKDIGVGIVEKFLSKVIVIHYGAQQNPLPTNQPSVTPVKTTLNNKTQVVNNKQTITHDGSRTGPIIDYKSLCEGKTIKVYENETIPFTTRTGEKIYSTQGDIDCYYKRLQQTDQQNTQTNNYRSSSNFTDTSPTYPPCTVYYPSLGYSKTYTYTSPETCKIWQETANIGSTNTYQPTPTLTENQAQTIIDQHNSQVRSCQGDVVYRYNNLLQSCNQYGSSSAADACRTITGQQRQRDYDACGSIY